MRNADEVVKCLKFTGCVGVMSAEPLLVDPFLFAPLANNLHNTVGEKDEKMHPQAAVVKKYLLFAAEYGAPFKSVREHALHALGYRNRSYQAFSRRGKVWEVSET